MKSDRKQSKSSLKAMADTVYLSAILNNLDSNLFIVDQDCVIVDANKPFLDLIGIPREDAIGRKCSDLLNILHITCLRETSCPVRKAFKTGKKQTLEFTVPGEKESKYFRVYVAPLSDTTGKVLRALTTIEDITDRKRTETELMESKDFYQSILQGITGVWVTDKKDVIYYSNKGMSEIAGIPPEKIEGARVLKDFPESTLKYFRPFYKKAKKTLKPVHYDAVPVVTPAGRESYQSGWLIPMIKNERYDGIICTVEDIH